MSSPGAQERRFRRQAGAAFRYVGDVFYVGVAVVLALAGVAFALGLVIFLLRHTTHSEPRLSYEPSRGDKA